MDVSKTPSFFFESGDSSSASLSFLAARRLGKVVRGLDWGGDVFQDRGSVFPESRFGESGKGMKTS